MEMGAEVSTWCPPSGVSVCTSACEAKETLRFLCFCGPGTLPINSISDGPSAAIAAAYAVALAFFSSEIGVFGGILEVHVMIQAIGAGSDPRGHLWVTWGVYLCADKPPLADIILSHPPDLTRCDSVIGLAIPAMSGHIQYRGAASADLYIRISGINRVLLS